jgi:glycosyltransferase involved in cell wall biosynthesis
MYCDNNNNLSTIRVLTALNGLELFGHERGNIEVYKALRDCGADVLVGVNQIENGDKVGAYLRDLGFKTFNLPFGSQWSWKWLRQEPLSIFEKWNQLWGCSRTFSQQIRVFQPTHLHLGSLTTYNYLVPALMSSNVPLIYRVGDAPPINSPYNLHIWHLAMRRSSKIVANSKFIRQQILAQNIQSEKIEQIYSLAPLPASSTSHELDDVDRSGLVYVGQMAEHKGVLPLLESLGKIKGIELNLVGGSIHDDEFISQLRDWTRIHQLQERVHFIGMVKDPSSFYAKAMIHIAPSIWNEPLANVVLEAKRMGTPSVVFPSGGLPEMIQHGIDGYVCRDRTVEALVEALEWMLSDTDRLAQMGAAARVDYETRFGRQRFLEEWSQVYLNV